MGSSFLVQGSITIDFAKVVENAENETQAMETVQALIGRLESSIAKLSAHTVDNKTEDLVVDELWLDGDLVSEEVDEDTPVKYKNSHQISALVTKF